MIKEFLNLFSEWQMELEEELREESVARISNGHVSNAVKLSKIRTEGMYWILFYGAQFLVGKGRFCEKC